MNLCRKLFPLKLLQTMSPDNKIFIFAVSRTIEYLKMHLHKRGMYTLEEIQQCTVQTLISKRRGLKVRIVNLSVVEDIEKQDVVSLGTLDDYDESKQEDLNASSQNTFQLSKYESIFSVHIVFAMYPR